MSGTVAVHAMAFSILRATVRRSFGLLVQFSKNLDNLVLYIRKSERNSRSFGDEQTNVVVAFEL